MKPLTPAERDTALCIFDATPYWGGTISGKVYRDLAAQGWTHEKIAALHRDTRAASMHGGGIITSTVVAEYRDPAGEVRWVRTRNSVYRVDFYAGLDFFTKKSD